MTFNFKSLLISFVGFCWFLNAPIWSQVETEEFNFVKIKEGISKVGITSIIQDPNEFIWIGTQGGGLYRYDGIEYVNYRHKMHDISSINSSLIYCTYIDKNSRLWIGTEEGLNLYDRNNDRFIRVPLLMGQKENKMALSVRSIKEDNKGNLFIGTFELGLFKLELETFNVEKILNTGAKDSYLINIHAIEITEDRTVYIGTDEGLKKYNYQTNTVDNCLFQVSKELTSIKDPIRSMLKDAENNIWIGTVSKGLIKIKEHRGNQNFTDTIERFLISENVIFSMISLPNGTLMCGTENDGLFHVNIDGKILKNYRSVKSDEKSILSNSVWSLYVDRNERIWMGTYNKGVSIYDKRYDKFNHIESLQSNSNSLQVGPVYGIVQDEKDNYWVCMDGGGIDIIDPKLDKITHINKINNQDYTGLTSDYIETIFIDSKNNIWAGSWDQGLFLLKKGSKKFINYNTENTQNGLKSNTILSIGEDAEGTIWIGSFYKGLHSYNPENHKFVHHDSKPFLRENITENDVRKILIDTKGNIWLGTTLGLFKINKLEDNSFSVVSMTDRMSKKFNEHTSANHILSLYECSNNTLWIGTRGAGLCNYDMIDDEFIWYNKLNNLQEENVNAIIESLSGDIWISGNSGLTRLDVKNEIFTNFTLNDGLLSNDFNINAAYRDKIGKLYFGNYEGVDYFDPDQISINPSTPSLYLTELKIFNKKVIPNHENSPLDKVISESKSITLKHDKTVFTIEYSGINFTRPEKNQYAYYLEGFEKEYKYVGNIRSATYTNLNPGEYTFKLKSANNDGVWNEQPLIFGITVLPPWWKTDWALLMYMAFFFFGIYLLNMITRARIQEKELIHSERKKRIQEEELNEKKLRFFTNISHEFRTPLTLIMNPLEDIIQTKNLQLPKFVREKHQIIYKNADRLSRLIMELMDFRKLELNKARVKAQEIDLIPFTNNIIEYFNDEASSRDIYVTLEANDEELNIWADQSMLEKIIYNILSNAFKVTPEGGAITICISLKNQLEILPIIDKEIPTKVFEISIKDTGSGLNKDQLAKIFKRFYQVVKLNNSYYGGTGIGLEVVRNFVELHKGKIEVESTLNVGTVFKIYLPFGKDHFAKNQIISMDPIATQVKKAKFKLPALKSSLAEEIETEIIITPLTLLIVEDNIELVNYLRSELSIEYKILIASNGKKGLELMEKAVPDIIITDVIMPEMNGFDFCIHIKNDLRFSHIPILMLTTKTMTDDWVKGIDSGADAYMSKPFNMRILKSRLSQLTTNRQLLFNKYFSAISDISNTENTTSLDKDFIQKVLNHINDNLSDPELSVESIASELKLSRSQFYRKIKSLTGQTANEFLRKVRLQRAKLQLEKGNFNISEVCYGVGFSTPSYFTKCFKNEFGMLPTEVKIRNS